MSTNNSEYISLANAEPPISTGFSQPNENQLLDSSVIAAMASAYFPEWSDPASSPPHFSVPQGVPQQSKPSVAFSEDVFVKAISTVNHSIHTGECQALKKAEAQPFAFLQDTRSIFSAIEQTASQPSVPTLADIASSYDGNTTFSPVIMAAGNTASGHFDVNAVRKDFPILAERVNGKPLIWFDNAATTHKPNSVIERITYFYEHENSNVHRGAHTLAARSTDAYEGAREKVSAFLNAPSAKNIVFVRGATEAINLVAQSWAKYNLQQDDEIIVTLLEHHANIVPWQMVCAETGAKLRVIPVDDAGQILLEDYEKLLSPKTKLVAATHVSNALGTITPVAEIVQRAHRYGAKVLIDGAQAVSHVKVDVQALDCDFYVFSGHKIFAPTGIGVLYGKTEILNSMRPYQGGGNMIADVTFEKTVYQAPPNRFEAGTGNIADAVGLGAAIDYVNSLGMENINRYEHALLEYGMEALQRIPGLRLIGTAKEKASVMSFVIDGFTNEEIGKALAEEGIAVRSGHHCAQPILRRFALEAAVRPSLAFYNTFGEIDKLVSVLWQLKRSRIVR